MRGTGTPYLVEIMNRFDLLPVQNFRFGRDQMLAKLIAGEFWNPNLTKQVRMGVGMAARWRAPMGFRITI